MEVIIPWALALGYPLIGLVSAPFIGSFYYRRAMRIWKKRGLSDFYHPSPYEWAAGGFLQSMVWPIALLIMFYAWIVQAEDRAEAREKARIEHIEQARKVIAEYEDSLKAQYPTPEPHWFRRYLK